MQNVSFTWQLKGLAGRVIGLCAFALVLCLPTFAQAKLVLDGGKINIHAGASMVITNPAGDAIIRNSGHIISEGENNVLQWHIGATEGSYLIPWGVGNDKYIPLSFVKSGGEGNGFYTFSTYGTGWQNSRNLPAVISRLERDGSDMSALVVDRFWQINAENYAVSPSAAELTFTYLEEESTAEGNTILEDNLQAYRWNETLNQWDDYYPAGVADPASNTVTLTSVEGEQFYRWWFVADAVTPLPVEFLFFRARANGGYVRLNWATASEKHSGFFTVERSKDGKVYEAIKTVKGVGNSNVRVDYTTTDSPSLEGLIYYRLRQVDLDGTVQYSKVQGVDLTYKQVDKPVVYPNPITSKRLFVDLGKQEGEEIQVELLDMLGRQITSQAFKKEDGVIEITVAPSVKPGAYILQVQVKHRLFSQKVIVQ